MAVYDNLSVDEIGLILSVSQLFETHRCGRYEQITCTHWQAGLFVCRSLAQEMYAPFVPHRPRGLFIVCPSQRVG